jgi:hypothetical protein
MYNNNLTTKSILAIVCIVLFASCFEMGGKKTTIRITDDENSIEIKYKGDIEFNEDNYSIASMSPNSYLKFKKNGKYINAVCNEAGEVVYVKNGHQQNELDENDKRTFTKAVKEILKAQHR